MEMVKKVRTSKWASSLYSGLLTMILMALVYLVLAMTMDEAPNLETWLTWVGVLVTVQIVVAYRTGQKTQHKIDQLQLAMKQVSAGGWNTRLPVVEGDAFSGVFREMNAMMQHLEGRLKLLQQLGEREVMEGIPAQEEAVLEERKRLARDLHDTVSQQLFALHMSASSA